MRTTLKRGVGVKWKGNHVWLYDKQLYILLTVLPDEQFHQKNFEYAPL